MVLSPSGADGFPKTAGFGRGFADAGFIIYKKQVFFGSELAVVPKHAAGELVAIELGTVTLEAFERPGWLKA